MQMNKIDVCRVCGLTLKNVEITQAMIDELEKITSLDKTHDNEVLKKIGKIELTRHDFKRVLFQDELINDTIINASVSKQM